MPISTRTSNNLIYLMLLLWCATFWWGVIAGAGWVYAKLVE